MKTTLEIADDVLAAAEEMSRRENKSTGEVISDLARRSLSRERRVSNEEYAKAIAELPSLPRRNAPAVTSAIVNNLRDLEN